MGKFLACTEDERQIILKTLDCMAEQFISRRYKSSDPQIMNKPAGQNAILQFVSVGFILPPAVDVNFPNPINRRYFVSGIQPVQSS